jgi:acyl carrier protein
MKKLDSVSNSDTLNIDSGPIVDQILNCISLSLSISIEQLTVLSSIGEFPEWDSLGHITLYFAIQETFGIKIPLENAGNIRSVADWARVVEAQL